MLNFPYPMLTTLRTWFQRCCQLSPADPQNLPMCHVSEFLALSKTRTRPPMTKTALTSAPVNTDCTICCRRCPSSPCFPLTTDSPALLLANITKIYQICKCKEVWVQFPLAMIPCHIVTVTSFIPTVTWPLCKICRRNSTGLRSQDCLSLRNLPPLSSLLPSPPRAGLIQCRDMASSGKGAEQKFACILLAHLLQRVPFRKCESQFL